MSSRVLRKLGLQGEKDLNSLGNDESDTEADFSSSSSSKKKQLNINRYDLVSWTQYGVTSIPIEAAESFNGHFWFCWDSKVSGHTGRTKRP
ncbi:unnamed protein product, partial [Nesidiocoris tenuis]